MEDLVRQLHFDFGWSVSGAWTAQQLEVLWETGKTVERQLADLQSRPAGGWVPVYLPTRFRHAGRLGRWRPLRRKSFVFPRRVVSLHTGFESARYPYGHIIHELGHVLDNHLGGWLPSTFVGGGPADRMIRAVGGRPWLGGPRFLPIPGYVGRVTPEEHWPVGAYANVNIAEDFAETFALTLLAPQKVPPVRLAWMQAFLTALPPGPKRLAEV